LALLTSFVSKLKFIPSEPRDLHFGRATPVFELLVEVRDSQAVNINRAEQLPIRHCFANTSLSITRRAPFSHLKSFDTGGEKGCPFAGDDLV
jgi:hypothetical protein